MKKIISVILCAVLSLSCMISAAAYSEIMTYSNDVTAKYNKGVHNIYYADVDADGTAKIEFPDGSTVTVANAGSAFKIGVIPVDKSDMSAWYWFEDILLKYGEDIMPMYIFAEDANGDRFVPQEPVEVTLTPKNSYNLPLVYNLMPSGEASPVDASNNSGEITFTEILDGYFAVVESPKSDTDSDITDTDTSTSTDTSSNTDTSDNTDTSTSTDTSTDTTSDTEDDTKYMYGDVDCNGKVNMEDVVALQRIMALLTTHESFGAASRENSDCNHDKIVNMLDVVQLQRYLADLIPTLDP